MKHIIHIIEEDCLCIDLSTIDPLEKLKLKMILDYLVNRSKEECE